jgi:beta-galactosidase/beta-glucuronidase
VFLSEQSSRVSRLQRDTEEWTGAASIVVTAKMWVWSPRGQESDHSLPPSQQQTENNETKKLALLNIFYSDIDLDNNIYLVFNSATSTPTFLLASIKLSVFLKNGVFWDVTPCGSRKNRRFGGT